MKGTDGHEMNMASQSLLDENRLLRELLAFRVAGVALYTDDGELQDNSATPSIDFRRDPVARIQSALQERLLRKAKTVRWRRSWEAPRDAT